MTSVRVAQPLGTTRPKLGLDELRHVVEMISPEYPRHIGDNELRYFGLEPMLSKDDRIALCSLSLSCRSLRQGAQSALMRHIYIGETRIEKMFDFLAARYQGTFPVRKLTITAYHGPVTRVFGQPRDGAKKLIELLKRCSDLEFLSIEDIPPPQKVHSSASPGLHFKRLATFRYLQAWESDTSIFGPIIPTMPCLKNLGLRLTTVKDLQLTHVHQLEVLSLIDVCGLEVARWISSNSFESLHTFRLLRLRDTQEIMDTLSAFLEIVGSRLRVLHISSDIFRAPSIVSLILACPNLEDLAVNVFEPDQVIPAFASGNWEDEPGDGPHDNIIHILDALCAPLLRLHIILEPRFVIPPPFGFILPSLCEALQRDHEKLAKLELVSLEVWEEGEVGDQYFSLNPRHGIVAVCQGRGLRLLCCTKTDSVEWGPE